MRVYPAPEHTADGQSIEVPLEPDFSSGIALLSADELQALVRNAYMAGVMAGERMLTTVEYSNRAHAWADRAVFSG